MSETELSRRRGGEESRPAAKLYFVSGLVDFLMIGGLSLLAFAGLKLFHSGARTPQVIHAASALLWTCSWPHFSATNYRLYGSRANMAQYPVTAVVVPLLVAAAAALSLASPERVAPFFIKLFLIWSPYHFSGQTVGVTLIYARRAGFDAGRWGRLALSGFVFGTFVAQTALGETGAGLRPYYGISVANLGLPPWVATAAQAGMWACGGAFLAAVLGWCLRARRVLPPIVLLPAATQYVWFVAGAGVDSFREFVPSLHALQYLLVAWAMRLKERLDEEGLRPSPGYVLAESLRWGLGNVVGGAGLFWLLPRAAARLGFPMPIAEPVAIAAVQVHHFFVDGVIWKLRNPKVTSPLLVNVEELLGEPVQVLRP